MKIGKVVLMGGVAAIAMATATGAQAADTDGTYKPLVLAQNLPPSNGSGISNNELATRVQALEDALAARDERAMADRTRLSTLEQSYNSAAWSFDNGRPSFASGDGRFTFNVRMRFQTDYANFMQNDSDTRRTGFAGPTDLGSGAVMRRAYVGFDGKVYKDFAYDVRFNFGGSNGGGTAGGNEGDALLNRFYLSYIGIPNWHFSVGVLEPVFAGELSQSSSALPFIERTEVDNIAAQYGAGDTRRGIEIGWSKTDTLWTGDHLAFTTSFTGGTTGTNTGHTGNGFAGDEQSQWIARLSERLWTNGISNIQIGANYGKLLYTGGNGVAPPGVPGVAGINLQDRPQMRVDGTRLISTGTVNAKEGEMFSFDFQGNLDNVYMAGEWARFSLDRLCSGTFTGGPCFGGNSNTVADTPSFDGWYIEGTYVLTGETKPYTTQAINNEVGAFGNPVPSRPFSLDGESWGAWELTARYSDMNLNWNPTQLANSTQLAGIPGGDERIVTLGINWYMNRNVKLQVNDMIVKVKRSSSTAAANFGNMNQDLNILGVRLAFAN